ncbi:AMP-binding protein [Natronosporangium hydrolyticum]|uniref:AMP-binding protein n=1 Tax=Natronosporangium hydrolyticum TaxID=2811111 RepID=A0A895YPH6_9ACTN|nr:AMP-binding protein [Natronosporangium hydrolyticum]QSB16010.1 AMP-binding protein [Natronosporangium hydrolyticum]
MAELAGVALYSRFMRGLESASRDNSGRAGAALRVGGTEVTYPDAHQTALSWAHRLVDAGAGPEHPVAVLAARSVTAYLGLLAGLYAGAPVVPLNPAFPVGRTAEMLRAAGAELVVADPDGAAIVPELAELVGRLAVLAPSADAADRASAGGRWLPVAGAPLAEPVPVNGDTPALMLFTSGSTGRPKGVPISHASLYHYFTVLDQRYDFHPGDVFSQTFDLNFDCAMFDLFCAWGAGATVLSVPPSAYLGLPGFLADHGVTVWFSTPSSIGLARRMGALTSSAMPGLRWSFFAGEALRCDDVERWSAAAVNSTVENLYGPTELTITISGYQWCPTRTPEVAINGVVPIGEVHPGHDYLIVGEDGDADPVVAAPGELGELWLSGPQLTTGYLDPADDAGRFVEYAGRRWYRTGDRVSRIGAAGLAYRGRLDSQVQVHGWRVELAEIEHALRGCSGVTEAVAVGVANQDGTELIAFYTGDRVGPAELTRRLRELLPAGFIPRRFQHVAELPLNSNRKVDRSLLRSRAEELLGSATRNDGRPGPTPR